MPFSCARALHLCFLEWATDSRGTGVATFNFAVEAQRTLGHKASFLVGPLQGLAAGVWDEAKLPASRLRLLREHFASVRFHKRPDQLGASARALGCDAVYLHHLSRVNSEESIAIATLHRHGVKVMLHCMGWCITRQGDAFAVTSEWAQRRFHVGPVVHLPVPRCPAPAVGAVRALRAELRIPKRATLLCYMGGPDSFSIAWVRKALFGSAATLRGWLDPLPELHLLFMPMQAGLPEHARVHSLPATSDPARKAAFYHACDGLLHARSNGESFGMVVAEFSSCNKPVITQGRAEGAYETAHLDMLGARAWAYAPHSPDSLLAQIRRLASTPRNVTQARDWNAHAANEPAPLMRDEFHPKLIAPLGLCDAGG